MRILVTRASEDAARSAAALDALGFEAVIAPLTRIVATGEPLPAGIWDALILTSPHAAGALAVLPDRAIPVFAVGPRTAEAVRALKFEHVHAGEGDALSLVRLIRREVPATARLLHATTQHRKDEPAASLRAAGYWVEPWETYEAQAAHSLSETGREALRAGRIDAVLHYSRRSAELLLRLAAEADLTAALGRIPHLCLSEDVAEPLRPLWADIRVAQTPTERDLLRLLDQ